MRILIHELSLIEPKFEQTEALGFEPSTFEPTKARALLNV